MKTPAELNPNIGEPAPSPFGFANVPAFEKPIEIKIQGIIPSWVNGVLYRSGMFYSLLPMEHVIKTLG